MTRDTFSLFEDRDRGRFGDNESADDASNNRVVKSDLVDLDLLLHNDNPSKKAIAVSLNATTPFERWSWLPRSMIEVERTGDGIGRCPSIRVTLPEKLAKDKGLI